MPGKDGEIKVISYEWMFPDFTDFQNIYAIGFILFGFITVWVIERIGSSISIKSKTS